MQHRSRVASAGGAPMMEGVTWRAREREPITGVWGGAPSGVQGQSPLKLKAFEHLGVNRRWQICQFLCILRIHFAIKQHKSTSLQLSITDVTKTTEINWPWMVC